MKRYFSGITAQQAPSPRAARQALVSLPGTVQTASQMPHAMKVMTNSTRTAISSNEMMVEEIDENRLARSQRRTGLWAPQPTGGRVTGRGACGASVAVTIASALRQRDARIVPVHEQADAEADGQKHRHDQRDRLDRLAGLVQRGVGDRDDVLVADRNRQRRILGQVQILT